MWICPVCKRRNEADLICVGCGFDESSNYEKYCTLAVVDSHMGFSGNRKRERYGWKDVYQRGLDCLAIGDYETAMKYLRLAAENGEVEAQFTYGSLCYGGIGERDREAARWFREAALQGHAEAQYYLGRCYFLGEGGLLDYAESIRWLEESRKGGCKAAESFLECYVYSPEGGADLNVFNWYVMLAERGNIGAQLYLGDYWGNFGTPLGYAEAVKWYGRAADAGSPKGKWKMGACYYSGKGVECDLEKAVGYYRMAAFENDSVAQSLLGMCYEFGNGVEKDLQKAVMWYREAASRGNKEAKKRVDALLKK